MSVKRFKGAPFGIQSARFDVSGVHPKSKLTGTYTELPYDPKFTNEQSRKLGPGTYITEENGFHAKAVNERCSGPGWARQYEVERMAAMPQLLHKDMWQERHSMKQKLGPGTYNIKDFLQTADDRPRSLRGICDTRAARFSGRLISNTPGPGTYGIPQAKLEEKSQRSTSTKGMLDAASCHLPLPTVGCHLGPGQYNSPDYIDQLLNKVTSLRGPYDLFSGDMSKPITAGHFAAPKLANLAPGQYEFGSFLDEWNKHHKRKKGEFGKVAQYPNPPVERIYCATLSQCPRSPSEPGPDKYYPQLSKADSPNKNPPGFLSSSERCDRRAMRFFTGNFNSVGPGRYDVQKFAEKHRNGFQSGFKSKTGRLSFNMEKAFKERIRGKDVPVAERMVSTAAQGLPGSQIHHHMYKFNQRLPTTA